VYALAAVPGPERLSVAHGARLQGLEKLPPQDRQRAIRTLSAVPKQDRLETALLSARLCQEDFEIEGLCAVTLALRGIDAHKRMDVAEAVKQFRVRGSPGSRIADMLTATASVPLAALADFTAMMLEIRFVLLRAVQKAFAFGIPRLPPYFVDSRPQRDSTAQNLRTDAFILGTAQACDLLAAVDSGVQRALVGFCPRLLEVSRSHEDLFLWLKCLAGMPQESWEEALDRFDKLRHSWGGVPFDERVWPLLVSQIMPMQVSNYRKYLRSFGQLDRPTRASGERLALLTSLARVHEGDMVQFVYTVNALAEPGLIVGEAYEELVGLLSGQPPEVWESLPEACDDLSEHYSGVALGERILERVKNLCAQDSRPKS
jgi:hypothetical protein